MLRIRDPIHNYIHLDALGAELADLPRVQRLRRVQQLGMGSLVYPGANHTRFEHSLGAHHLAGLAAEALALPPEDRLAVQAAALLHDVGHGPFSHLCDPLFRDYLRRTHEDVAVEALQKGALPDLLERHGVDPARVASLVRGEGPLAGLVSGDLDVDRMDYLVRDSHYTGVNIGVDLARLVADVAITPRGVAIHERSVPAAEMLLVTRLQMYATVYHHRTMRVAERMVERALRLAIDAGEIRADDLPRMDDVAATYLLRHSKTDAWRWMKNVDHRKLHKVALEEPIGGFREDAIAEVAASHDRRLEVEARIADALRAPPADVLLDAPEPPTLPEGGALVVREGGDVVDLHDVSALTRTLGAAQRDHWRLRVMVPEKRRAEAGPVAARVLAEELG
ncbi:MAG TPA: HD domain-containing protein [Candidatus Thermoplasmatota archaeon]|nr:HD domain-containing protein [Candidatus Thermoplasmatota archaeon]